MSWRLSSTNRVLTQPPVWNKELLFVGGFLARAAYELEIQVIRTHWDASIALKQSGEPLDKVLHTEFYNKARHNLQFFTFHPSTPSALVSNEMRSAFFGCAVQGQPFPVVSRVGIVEQTCILCTTLDTLLLT